jgi:hypothetical protein
MEIPIPGDNSGQNLQWTGGRFCVNIMVTCARGYVPDPAYDQAQRLEVWATTYDDWQMETRPIPETEKTILLPERKLRLPNGS